MSRFADDCEAKQFAVELILSEAERAGIYLSELERKMLYFSETGWTIPGMAETAQKFENECDSGQYEKKINALTKRLHTRLQSDDPLTLKAWSDALRKLNEGDHYLLVLISATASSRRPPHDFLKLCMTALVIILIGILIGGGLMALLPEDSTGPLGREKSAFLIWLLAAIAASVLVLLSLIMGRQKVNDLLVTLMSKISGGPKAKH